MHSYPVETTHQQWYGDVCQYNATNKNGEVLSLGRKPQPQNYSPQNQNVPVQRDQNIQNTFCGMFLQDEPHNACSLTRSHQAIDSLTP